MYNDKQSPVVLNIAKPIFYVLFVLLFCFLSLIILYANTFLITFNGGGKREKKRMNAIAFNLGINWFSCFIVMFLKDIINI